MRERCRRLWNGEHSVLPKRQQLPMYREQRGLHGRDGRLGRNLRGLRPGCRSLLHWPDLHAARDRLQQWNLRNLR
jgi:hypothetical protein